MIPAAEGQRHAPRARLDEPPRDKHVLHQFRSTVVAVLRIALAVARADFRVFLFDVEGVQHLARGEQVDRLLVERVHAFHQTAVVHGVPELVEIIAQRLAVAQAVHRDAVEHHVVHARAVRLEGRVGNPEETRLARVRPAHLAHLRRHADKRRHRAVYRPL